MAVAKRTKARGLYILLAQEQDAKAHTRKQDDNSNEHNRRTNGAASRKDNNEKPATKPTKREKTKERQNYVSLFRFRCSIIIDYPRKGECQRVCSVIYRNAFRDRSSQPTGREPDLNSRTMRTSHLSFVTRCRTHIYSAIRAECPIHACR